jgi:hypothetical protein
VDLPYAGKQKHKTTLYTDTLKGDKARVYVWMLSLLMWSLVKNKLVSELNQGE